MSAMPPSSTSPYSRSAQLYIDNGLCVIPIAPGTKRPGEFSGGAWRGMSQWDRYTTRLPSEIELEHWDRWPDAGIGMLCGKISNVVALDFDTEDKLILSQIGQLIPISPVKKRGRKGFTAFYRYNGEPSHSWNVRGERILDLLSDGRQTLMPGTAHPEGMTYLYLTEDRLEDFDINSLPLLPKNIIAMIDQVVAPHQSQDDKRVSAKARQHADTPGEIQLQMAVATYWRETNIAALERIDEWVPTLVPGAKPAANGYRCVAYWRGGEGLNVGIDRKGIKDFAGDVGLTPIDLVMHAQNITVEQACGALRQILSLGSEQPIVMTVKGRPMDAPIVEVGDAQEPEPAQPVRPAAPAWSRPAEPAYMPKPDEDPLVRAMRERDEEQTQAEQMTDGVPEFVTQAPGMLARLAGWMAETAPKSQPELFLAAAISTAATAMGRLYRTNFGNWPALYIILVAKSAEGKEHPQQCAANVLQAAGLDRLMTGSGYTSPGAVFSALMQSPSHLAIIDEIGKLLKISRSAGNSNAEGAIDKLVEAFTRCEGYMVPQNYSKMTLGGAALAASNTDKSVFNPSINMLGATTPGTFYGSLTDDLIKDGFLGRLVVVRSNMPRQMMRMCDRTEPPDDVVQWIKSLHEEPLNHGDLSNTMNPLMKAAPMRMVFAPECQPLLTAFEHELLIRRDELESRGLDVLMGRTAEKAMRLSMVVAKAINPPRVNTISSEALQWSINYVRYYDERLIRSVVDERTINQVEESQRKMMTILRTAKANKKDKAHADIYAAGGTPASKLQRLLKLDSYTFKRLIETSVDMGYISKQEGWGNYHGTVFFPRSDIPDNE